MLLRQLSLVIAVILSVANASALIERRVERRFEVPGAASLKIDTFNGSVHVSAGQDPAIEVTVIEQGDVTDEAAMDDRVKDLDLRMEQKEAAVSLVARYHRRLVWSWMDWPPLRLAYEIKVPPQCDITVVTRDGSIVLGSLRGKLDLSNDSGEIFTGEIDGGIKARSRVGDIALTACTGLVTARTRMGNITVGRAGGRTELSSDGGYIELQSAAGEVVVRGSGADVKVGFAGSIVKPAKISTSGGDISLALENDAACALDLRASIFGHVKVRDLALVTTGGAGRSRLAGTLNGGGPLIAADAGGGSILVRGFAPVPESAAVSATRVGGLPAK